MCTVRRLGILLLVALMTAPVWAYSPPEPEATMHTQPLGIQVHFPAIPFEARVETEVIAAVEGTIKQSVQELLSELLSFGSVFGTYEVDLDRDELLSVTLTYSAYRAPMAHPMHYSRSLNFDMRTGQLLTLDDLFEGDYLNVLSDHIKVQIEQDEIPLLRDFDGIDATADFFLTPESVVIYFQLYDLAPYAWGFPEFAISYRDLAPFIRDAYRQALL